MNEELLAIQREKLEAAGLCCGGARRPGGPGGVFDDEYGANRLRVQLLDPQQRHPANVAVPTRSGIADRMTAFDEYAALEVELGRLLHVVRRRNEPVLVGAQQWAVPRIATQIAAAASAGDVARVTELEAYQAECVRVWQATEAAIEAIMANAYVRARIHADDDDAYGWRNAARHRETLWARVLP